ncbi:RluA family pseudouridine synthase [Haliangium ochraceum]|uniref:Pseudouridine synthase, RluA family n=1 Tax=Haliangium ochraceum (strain DSM 14365 / JCM 11303 / SMP-2) TaxID=502025 RepID=D0LYX0_HALO1|nr:RluA family pseudouridine synthase [Haliangium ochraceum]ACY14440.1 pseudouridine synthase, RluA family [Haliangium ochraceum DSM 14365]
MDTTPSAARAGAPEPAARFAAPRADRADKLVGEHFPAASRRRVTALFADGRVRVNGRKVKKGAIVPAGAEIALTRLPVADEELVPQANHELVLDLLYEDDAIAVVSKPAGLPSHPLRAGERDTLANALVAHYPECAAIGADPREAGLAHRLDIDTSGVLVAARTQKAWHALRAAFGSGAVEKHYLALTFGAPSSGEMDVALVQRGRRAHPVFRDDAGFGGFGGRGERGDALPARTTWRIERRFGPACLLLCRAHTGRMHQIRVHLALAGAPIIGDSLYAPAPETLSAAEREDLAALSEHPEATRHFLHASAVTIPHPETGRALRIEAPLPEGRAQFLAELSRRWP